jgi:hypothetical protein
MKSLRYLIVVVLFCFANSASAQQTGTETPKPKLFTAADLQKLRWIEGSWRGTGVNQVPFFERYRFENSTTLAVDGLEGDKVTETTRFELKDGEFGGGNEGSRWVATAIDENSITFAPVAKARNWFRWERVNADSWKAVLNWPASTDKPARERVYNMERRPQPGSSPGSSELSRLIVRRIDESRSAQTAEWQNINADGLFAFRLPQGFTKTNMMGVEHYLGEYYKGKARFLFVWGDTASNAYDVRRQPDMEEYRETETGIAGKRANVRTYSQIRDGARIYRAELNVGDWERAQVELYMEIESNNPADLETAKQIFNSITFSKKRRG